MNSTTVIDTLENLASETGQDLTPDEIHSIYFACAVIRSLPQNQRDLIDVILDLAAALSK